MREIHSYYLNKLPGCEHENVLLASFTFEHLFKRKDIDFVKITEIQGIDKKVVRRMLGNYAQNYFNNPYCIFAESNNNTVIIRGEFTNDLITTASEIQLNKNNPEFFDKVEVINNIITNIKKAYEYFVSLYVIAHSDTDKLTKNVIYSTSTPLINFIKELNIKSLQDKELIIYDVYSNNPRTTNPCSQLDVFEEIKADTLVILNSTPFTEIEMHHFNNLLVLNFDQKYDCNKLPLTIYDDFIEHFRGYQIYTKKEVFDIIQQQLKGIK